MTTITKHSCSARKKGKMSNNSNGQNVRFIALSSTSIKMSGSFLILSGETLQITCFHNYHYSPAILCFGKSAKPEVIAFHTWHQIVSQRNVPHVSRKFVVFPVLFSYVSHLSMVKGKQSPRWTSCNDKKTDTFSAMSSFHTRVRSSVGSCYMWKSALGAGVMRTRVSLLESLTRSVFGQSPEFINGPFFFLSHLFFILFLLVNIHCLNNITFIASM